MRCQKCQINDVNVKMTLYINGNTQQLHLCSKCYQEIQNEMKQPSGFGSFDNPMFDQIDSFMNGFTSDSNHKQEKNAAGKGGGRGGLLDELGRNLTDAAKAGLIDPVIGRDKEVKRVTEILNRRNKNNPVLIGEPGVGKTAIAEGLALKISEKDVPNKLLNKEVYLLDVSSLVANTGIRGQFEERMKQLIAELQQRKNVILFVDEVHLLVGAGSAEGSMDAGNILKPALARGELQIVGATTLKEYRQIEKDAALERRFQPVMVKEPTMEEAMEILKGLKPKYEDFHEVQFSDEALKACVSLSHRYIQDRFLPDKAIDLMDEAGSKMNLEHAGTSEGQIQERLEQIGKEKEEATKAEDYERAAKLRDEETKIHEQAATADSGSGNTEIKLEDIQLLVEEKTSIPVRKLQSDEQNKMKHFAERLGGSVIGQDAAVEKVAKAIRRSRAGLKSKVRPIGAFLFVGPTGVGKTELTKTLAKELFGSKESLIRLDMSEYMEKHSVSKLIGSPPGYVGHEEAGQLTERVRRNPYSIILLDEIEKAHPDVQHMFLQIMEDGRLTDSQGRTVSFKDTVIIMTSNAGTGEKRIKVGFENDTNEAVSILESLSAYFKPEFLNRFDAIIPFNELNEGHLVEIVDLMLDDIREMVADSAREIEVTEAAKKQIARLGYDPRFGARPIRRVLQEKVEDGIADLLLDEEDVTKIVIDVVDEEIVVRKGVNDQE
ncbi:ATP-dependent Clp protease ATP-binding subunit [Alkalihalobacillus sp. AL-G]|uniref:ATP-dependent Clp protease ATP-binding subunit n=1 Tax=Alkalihalobacillus sp. AL-G TaxID=2926399 RepID=UPI00272AFBCD|nr:ATP-dependent Clp protease ATP-binding subunit [Alkalihalobacillus sp. AL-G]WLD94205.1 AAA family ATPase [Alkalihalobacillus sp. AL-G]